MFEGMIRTTSTVEEADGTESEAVTVADVTEPKAVTDIINFESPRPELQDPRAHGIPSKEEPAVVPLLMSV